MFHSLDILNKDTDSQATMALNRACNWSTSDPRFKPRAPPLPWSQSDSCQLWTYREKVKTVSWKLFSSVMPRTPSITRSSTVTVMFCFWLHTFWATGVGNSTDEGIIDSQALWTDASRLGMLSTCCWSADGIELMYMKLQWRQRSGVFRTKFVGDVASRNFLQRLLITRLSTSISRYLFSLLLGRPSMKASCAFLKGSFVQSTAVTAGQPPWEAPLPQHS